MGAFLLADGDWGHFSLGGEAGSCEGVPDSAKLRLSGFGATAVMSAGLMISAYGTLHTTMLTGPRIPYALSRAGLLPPGLARISAAGVPAVAILTAGVRVLPAPRR
jgi:amino acid transporter